MLLFTHVQAMNTDDLYQALPGHMNVNKTSFNIPSTKVL